jgi:hypothetical protein
VLPTAKPSIDLNQGVPRKKAGHASHYLSWRGGSVGRNRRVSNGDQVNQIAKLALKRGKSVDFTGYWQRHIAE